MDRPQRFRARTWLAALAAAAGLTIGVAGAAGAATNGSTSGSSTPPAAGTSAGVPPAGPMGNPATVAHGPGETLLTGSDAAKAKAAALGAVPGGTVIRVESDSAGATYEAHVSKADGSVVTVKLDASFNVTATDAGFGGGPTP
jgi:hypothetical protein